MIFGETLYGGFTLASSHPGLPACVPAHAPYGQIKYPESESILVTSLHPNWLGSRPSLMICSGPECRFSGPGASSPVRCEPCAEAEEHGTRGEVESTVDGAPC
jgi:hypothetical protein